MCQVRFNMGCSGLFCVVFAAQVNPFSSFCYACSPGYWPSPAGGCGGAPRAVTRPGREEGCPSVHFRSSQRLHAGLSYRVAKKGSEKLGGGFSMVVLEGRNGLGSAKPPF